MPLAAADGAKGAGGAVFYTKVKGGANPSVGGGYLLLVGDSAKCPGHNHPEISVILSGSVSATVGGVAVALVGSPTSCGHPLVTPGANEFFTTN